ncbi:hypothetical protein [Rhizobium leguminosarum]|uniref:hypothetical protein n=1 Tax=Rhizobium leguminosarum TaxID=384 RepID=UPI001C98A2B1|nr:hypothetical protein [Rhizobium leguminosarum]
MPGAKHLLAWGKAPLAWGKAPLAWGKAPLAWGKAPLAWGKAPLAWGKGIGPRRPDCDRLGENYCQTTIGAFVGTRS